MGIETTNMCVTKLDMWGLKDVVILSGREGLMHCLVVLWLMQDPVFLGCFWVEYLGFCSIQPDYFKSVSSESPNFMKVKF